MTTIKAMSSEVRALFTERMRALAVNGTSMRDAAVTLTAEFPGFMITIDTVENAARNASIKFDGSGTAKTPLEREQVLFEEPRVFEELTIDSAPDGTKLIIVNDLQIPFEDPKTLRAVERFWDDLRPDIEVYNGDLIDFYNVSSFDKNPSRRFKLQDELDATRTWLYRRAEANPDARRIEDDGNHEDRLRRYLWKYGKELSGLRALELDSLLGFDELKVEHLPYGSVIDLLGYRIEHGHKSSTSRAYPVNVARFQALATGSSGLCGHTHRFSTYSWTDARGSHSYIENGCLCRFNMEYAPFPNWQQAFTYGFVHNNKVHLVPVMIYADGFRAEGEFYPRV
jgi:hypothetical protein